MNTQKALFSCLLLAMSVSVSWASDTVTPGSLTGGIVHNVPTWFKESFLEIADDVDEASAEGRHVLLFFQLNACPYCDRMLTEAFESEPLSSQIQEQFDAIAINVKGDRDIAFNEALSVTEKELSEFLEVRATPAILFLNSENKQVVRVNGYRSPKRFEQVLNFVSSKSYESMSLADYIDANLTEPVYQFREFPQYQELTDLSRVNGPLAVVIEDQQCYDCEEFYDRMLSREDVQQRLSEYTVVRIDADSDLLLKDVDGSSMTAKQLVNKYEMIYRPGVLLFDQGQLIRRHDSLAFTHHFRESLRYVSGGYHKTELYRDYSERRTAELLASGVNIDLSE